MLTPTQIDMKEKFPTNLWRKRGLRTAFPILLMASFMKEFPKGSAQP
jgi:hypothetical protein